MTKNNDTALLPIPKNREFWTFSEAEKLCAWYSENFETISLVLHNTRPAAPQNAEALGACDHIEGANNCHISVRGYYCFDPIHLDKIRADLNQPRTVKPLMWVDRQYHSVACAIDPICYKVQFLALSNEWALFLGTVILSSHESRDEAKAAAEAHWQQKIGECLV